MTSIIKKLITTSTADIICTIIHCLFLIVHIVHEVIFEDILNKLSSINSITELCVTSTGIITSYFIISKMLKKNNNV